MPKRGKSRRNWNDGGQNRDAKYYFEHDDRQTVSARRVIFKPTSGVRRRERMREWDLIRTQIEDDDVDMSMGSTSGKNFGRYNPYISSKGGRGGGRGWPRPARVHSAPGQNHGGRKGKVLTGSSWYQITVPYGAKYTKDYILKLLLNYVSPIPFVPIQFKSIGKDFTFYVDSYDAASELLNADRRITTNDGFKLNIHVYPGMPQIELTDSIKTLVKQAMVKRYNPATKALDLSNFHMDPDLFDQVMPLQRHEMMIAVLDIIMENIPELAALNLSENKLSTLESMSTLAKKLPNIVVLHLGQNRMRHMRDLDLLKGLRLEELVLEGNPVLQKYPEKSTYISEVRKRFPKVLKLDGVELPPPILFDVSEDVKVPPSKPHFVCAEHSQGLIQAFLEQYYGVYDSDSRQPLMDAYHENALFSLSCVYPPGQNQSSSTNKLNAYFAESRNLMRTSDVNKRRKLLRHGRLSVVSTLSELPRSEHDPQSFTFDLLVSTPTLVVVCLSGVFREPNQKPVPIRAFSRVFVIVPQGAGMCITNDQLLVTNATSEQSKVAFTPPKPVISNVVASPSAAPIATVGETVKLQLVEALSQQTGMNVLWSRKCLEDTNWDAQMALSAFSELSNKGLVPAEAFIK